MSLSTDGEKSWIVLATFPDYWAHLQAAQSNFSFPLVMPDMDCPSCVLRVRYLPNKPTEVDFWNCADVNISKTGTPLLKGSVYGYLAASNPLSRASVGLEAVGLADSGLPVTLGAAPPGVQLLDGIAAALGGRHYGLARNESTAAEGAPAWLLTVLDPSGSGALSTLPLTLPAGDADAPAQFTALSAAPAWGALVALGLASAGPSAPGKWVYQARLVDPATGAAGPALAFSAPQDTFVNVFAATDALVKGAGATAGAVYFLAGDENSLVALGAQVFTAALDTAAGAAPSAMTSVAADNSAWTLSNLHLDAASGRLMSVSPGLYGNTTWTLVEVYPATGAVQPVGGPVTGAPEALYAFWNGGQVGGAHPAGQVIHVFKHALDGTLALATLDAATGAQLSAPTLIDGVNSEVGFVALAYVAGAAAGAAARGGD